jgi:hypothetical protein
MKKEPQQKLSKVGLENYKTKVPYKEKGSSKTRAVKFVVTEDEMQALEMLCKDWNISIAQAVRTMIGIATDFGDLATVLNVGKSPQVKEQLKKHGKEPSELEWRLLSLQRFRKYWNINRTDVDKL